MPGLLVQLAIFGTFFVGFALISELRAGVIERTRVTPVSRLALLLGRSLRDVVTLLFQAALITVLSLPFGLRGPARQPAAGVRAARPDRADALGRCPTRVALKLRSEDALAPLLNTVGIPILLLSGILLPMTSAPALAAGRGQVEPVLLGGRRHPGAVRRRPGQPAGLAGAGHPRRADGCRGGLGGPVVRQERAARRSKTSVGTGLRQPVPAEK